MRTAGATWAARAPLARSDTDAVLIAQRYAPLFIAAAAFFAAYISRRPFEVLITLSDIFFFAGAGLLLAGRRIPAQPLAGMTVYWMLSFTVMIIGLLIGSLANGSPIRWLVAGVQYGFSFVMLPFLLMGHGYGRTISIAKALVAGVFCMELFGLVLYFGWDASYEQFKLIGPDFVTGARRLGAFLGDANWNSAVIAMTLPFIFFLKLRGAIGTVTAAVALGVLAMGIILAASVTGFVSGVVACALFMLLGGVRISAKWLIAMVGVAGLLLAAYGLPKAFQNRVAPALETADVTQAGTFTARLGLIEEAWTIVDKTTFVGIGVDQYRVKSVWQAPVHNMYLLLWAEGGLLALLGWLGLMMVMTAGVFMAYRRDRLAAALGLSVLSTFLIYSTASPHMYARVWVVPVFVAMAFVFNVIPSQETPRAGRRGKIPARIRNK